MRRVMTGCLIVLCCGAFVVSGCAKKNLVTQEEPIAAVPAVKAPAVDDTAAREQAARDAAAREAAVTSAKESAESTVITEVAKENVPSATLTQELAAIYFDFDSPALSAEARATLAKNAEFLNKKSGVKAKIEGHCDERGSDEYNLALGERRAKAALDYLVTMGIKRDRLALISYGKEKPVDPSHDEAAWAKNRRAEFIIIK